MTRILVMGLPGSGKTTFAQNLQIELVNLGMSVRWWNADRIRALVNDWDFSPEGRIRQAHRMKVIAKETESLFDFVISDFVAPTQEIRNIFDADILIWMDTIKSGRFEDTNKIFEEPLKYDVRVLHFNSTNESIIAKQLVDGLET